MKLKKHMRRGSLAALIALALTSSALAMPAGGEVVAGGSAITVDGGTDFSTINNDATIKATDDGQIDWQSFGIAQGETLNFDIADDKTLVNTVRGSEMSNLLGVMNQTGDGSLVLINGNGIYVGKDAVLNVGDLTLSTLNMTESGGQLTFTKGAGSGAVNLASGATINAADNVHIFGNTVNVADGVTFNLGKDSTNETMLDIKALDRADYTMGEDGPTTQSFTHNAGNNVTFNGTVNIRNDKESEVEIGGATVTSTGAKFYGNQLETTLYAAGKMGIDERAADRNDHRYTAETTAANTLTVDGLEARGSSADAKGEQLSLGGGVVSVKNSSAKVDTLSIEALSSYTGKGDGVLIETKAAPDRTVNVAGSRFDAAEVWVHGGKVTVDENTKFNGGGSERSVEIVAGSVDDVNNRFTTEKGNDLAFHGDIAGYKRTGRNPVTLAGNTVNLDHATVNAGRLNVAAGNDLVADEATGFAGKATTENTVSAADAVINTTDDTWLVGGKVAVKNSSFTSGEEVHLVAGNEVDLGKYTVAATADNTVRMENVKADVKGVYVVGGKTDLTGTKIAAGKEVSFLIGNEVNGDKVSVTKDNMLTLRRTTINAPVAELGAAGVEAYEGSTVDASQDLKELAVTRKDGSAGVYQRDAGSHIRQNGEEASVFKVVNTKPEPPKPEQPKPVPTPEVSKDDKENMDAGKKAVAAALAKNASQENRISALTDVVTDLNANASRRQSAGVVVGMIEQIEKADLSASEKAALQESVLSAYAPVQEAKTEQENLSAKSSDEAEGAVEAAVAAPVYPDDSEAEEVVSFS